MIIDIIKIIVYNIHKHNIIICIVNAERSKVWIN